MITCPNCGEHNPERARFCTACGTPLIARGSDEERKLVTVMFTELVSGSVALSRGADGDARSALDEFVPVTEDRGPNVLLPVAGRVMVAIGAVDDAAELVRGTTEPNARRLRLSVASAEAMVAEAEGLLEEAAAGYEKLAPEWVDYGFGLEEARVRLGLGRCLLRLGRRDETRDELAGARALAHDLGAEPVTAELDALFEGAPTP